MKSSRLLSLIAIIVMLSGPLSAADEMIRAGFSTEWMDRTVDPKTDFARYAWGGWARATEIPADKARWWSGDILAENNWRRVDGLLKVAAANPGPREDLVSAGGNRVVFRSVYL